jgi:tetratricopeptide (TPR) repeat protein
MTSGKHAHSSRAPRKDSKDRAAAPVATKRTSGPSNEQTSWPDRYFIPALIGLCLTGLAIRCLILAGYCGTPLAQHPINDARVYWEWAGDIAAGKLVLDHPFFSAPLYPYLLGGLRWLGGQLTSVYVLQMLADLAAVVLLGWTCRRRFGAGVALGAVALYLLLLEPASAMLRVLASSLHLLLVVAAWAALVYVQERQSWPRLLAAGAALGLLTVAFAPAILLLPMVAIWLFVLGDRKRESVVKALLPIAVAAVIVTPVTLHNWYAGGGLFPVQAGAGITLLQGNHATSNGSYTPIPGVSTSRDRMHLDTKNVYQQATGRQPNWADVDRYFRNQAFELWRSQPAKLIRLLALKSYMFVSARNYADIYEPTGEMAEGLNPRLRLAPLPLAWFIGPALVGLVLMLRKPGHYAPEWMFLLVPFAVVVTFFYSPRYRTPAIPIIVVMAAWTFAQGWQWRRRWPVLAAAVLALVVGMLQEPINKSFGFDRPDRTKALKNLAYALRMEHRVDDAIAAYRKCLAIDPQDSETRTWLGEALAEAGRREEGIIELRRALDEQPEDTTLAVKLANSLLLLNRPAEAEPVLAAAALREPDNPLVLAMLANTKHRAGQNTAACEYFEQALQLAPDHVGILIDYAIALMNMRRWDAAKVQFTRVLSVDPNSFLASFRLGVIAGHLGDNDEARRWFERASTIQPGNAEVVYRLAYVELEQGRREEAIRLLRKALELDPNHRPAQAKLRELESR